jgi:hypothetical protein
MAIFSFVRNGQTYSLNGPAGATEAQALAVLDAQLISGTLVGQPLGTKIDLKSQVASGLNLVGAQLSSTTVEAVDQLPNSLPADVIELSDISLQKPGEPVGTLDAEQVRGLLAQKAKSVGQELNTVSNNSGIGKYGISVQQLERAGYVKPGTSGLLATGLGVAEILNNPAAWTGKNNIENLNLFTTNAAIQQTAQQEVLQQAYTSLQAQGLIPQNILPQDLGAILNTASTFNTETAANWLQGKLSPETQAVLNTTARLGQYATTASQVATVASQGSLSSAIMLAGSTLGIGGVGLSQATVALSAFEQVYNSKTPVGQALQASFGSYGQKLSEQLGLGGDLQQKITEFAQSPGQAINAVLSEIKNIGGAIGSELSSAIQSLGGSSGLGDLASAVGGNQVFDGFGSLASDVFGGGATSIFDVTRVDAFGNEYAINLFTELKLEAATALDSVGSLFGAQNLGNTLFGNLAGVGDLIPVVGTAFKVFTTFFGGGSGDSSGLNFSLDSTPRPVQAFQNTVNRSTVDAAVTRIIGDAKVTDLFFGPISNAILRPIRVDVTGIIAAKSLIGQINASAARAQINTAFVNDVG